MAPHAPAIRAPSKQLTTVALGTNRWPDELFLNTPGTYNSGLPNAYELADLLFTDPDAPKEPQVNAAAGFYCWMPREGTICEITPVCAGADGATVNALFGYAVPLQRRSPMEGDPLQWRLDPQALMVWTAGTKTGVAGGIVDENTRYIDTIAITEAYWPEPNPLRIVGPRTAVDDATLAPNNTPVHIQFDIRQGQRAFLYLSLGTATSYNFLETSF